MMTQSGMRRCFTSPPCGCCDNTVRINGGRVMRMATTLIAMAALAVTMPVAAQTDDEDEDRRDRAPRTMTDPAQSLPSRQTGEAVLGGREAFDNETPQFQVGRRRNAGPDAAEAAAAGAQLTGNAQTLEHDREIGERVELVGSTNIVTISGQCVGLSISGDGN